MKHKKYTHGIPKKITPKNVEGLVLHLSSIIKDNIAMKESLARDARNITTLMEELERAHKKIAALEKGQCLKPKSWEEIREMVCRGEL